MSKPITLLVALSKEQEIEDLNQVLKEDNHEYELLFPDSMLTLDTLLNTRDIDIILLDFDFQNGALADWLNLWPIPFILFAGYSDRVRLEEMLKDEASSFIIRAPSHEYLKLLPILIRKVLYLRELQTIQNKHLQMSERRYLELVRALPDIIYNLDNEGNFIFVNDSIQLLGFDPVELIGKHFSEILQPDDVQKVSKKSVLREYRGKETGPDGAPKLFDERRKGERKTENLIVRLKKRKNSTENGHFVGSVTAYGEVSAAGFVFGKNEDSDSGTVGIIRDVTEKRKQELALKESIEEKTVLLREFHHRVKNNLQIISSLLNLHSEQISNPKDHEAFLEVQAEIQSMSLVHDHLCHSDSLNRIRMQDYITALFNSLCDMYRIDIRKITCTVSAQNLFLKLDKATPVGLILNELITNSLKHAFPNGREGRIYVTFSEESDTVNRLSVRDDGVGFQPGEHVKKSALGLTLVEMLVEQLQGTMEISGSDGVDVAVSLPGDIFAEGVYE